jgi:hypothetical protein
LDLCRLLPKLLQQWFSRTVHALAWQLMCGLMIDRVSPPGTIRSAQSWLAILTETPIAIGLNDYSLILNCGHFYMRSIALRFIQTTNGC